MIKPTNACISVFLFCWVIIIMVYAGTLGASCGGTWKDATAKSLNAATVMTDGVYKMVKPAYEKKCLDIADKCASNPCSILLACQAERHEVYAVIKAVQEAIKGLTRVLPLIESVKKEAGL